MASQDRAVGYRPIVLSNTIIISKDTMTAWRVENIIAHENVVFTAPSISQRAALYALTYRSEILEFIRNINKIT